MFKLDSKNKIEYKDHSRSFKGRYTVCPNPLCTCCVINLYFNQVDNKKIKPEIKVSLDLLNMKLSNDQPNRQNKNVSQDMVNNLGSDDWLFLTELYIETKNCLTEQADLSSLDIEYPIDEIEENGLLISFNGVLPYSRIITIDVNSVPLKIEDLYCVRNGCDCNEAHLFISRYRRNKLLFPFMEKESEEMYIIYNVKEDKWRLEEQSGLPIRSSIIMATLADAYDIKPFFGVRYDLMNNLYKYYIQKKNIIAKQPTEKIGRNDPCPCGSGLKYKKCCMNKGL